MDQIKEILRQAIKYRFWIAVGISAILPIIAYSVGSGPIKAKAAEKTEAIKQAEEGVKKYANGVVPNAQYKPMVNEQTAVLTKDVNNSWEKLYKRQAPLLRWPETVEERFRTWGNKWPENVDASAVRVAVIDYATAYPEYVTEVYKSFRPFDLVEGTGVVSAPPEAVLLKPVPFELKGSSIPELGKVWAAQERLWIQRALLQVVDEVNASAKEWDAAKIKQINLLDVGTPTSQDQVSIAEGVTLAEAPPLDPPGTDSTAVAEEPVAGMEANDMASMMPGMGSGMMGGGQVNADAVFYIQTDPPSEQYKIMPFQVSVLIEQNNVQDLLVALENSPMAIQVSEFAIAKPATRITKPVKGDSMWGGGMYGSGMMPGMGGMAGFGGAAMMPGMMPGMDAGMMPGMDSGMMPGMMPGGMMGGASRKGTDARGKDRAAARKEAMEKRKNLTAFTIHDPYYNVIELTVYGQARFYNAPPPPPAEEPSQSAEADAAPTDDPNAPAAAAEATPKADAPAAADAAEKDDAAKAEEPTKKDDAAKAEEPAKKDDAAKAEEPTKKDDAAKAEATPENAPEPAKADATTPKTQ